MKTYILDESTVEDIVTTLYAARRYWNYEVETSEARGENIRAMHFETAIEMCDRLLKIFNKKG